MSLLLSTDNLSKAYGPRKLFKGISISFDDTERTGIIGPNGAGKSTLLKILAGVEKPDDGTLNSRRQLRVGYLAQEEVFSPDDTVTTAVYNAIKQTNEDEHEKHTRVAILLSKIGFLDVDQLASSLSGGWRKRLAIARQLIQKPDLLLLDEPTNHLDLQGIAWLESLLAASPFAFVMVSHDRYMLENSCNRIVDLNSTYADGYLSAAGSYGDFLVKREDYLEAQSSREQALASRVRREVEWLRRGAKARTTKAKGRIEQAGQMMSELSDLKGRNRDAGSIQVDFAATNRQTRKLIAARNVSKALGGRTLFSNLHLVLAPGMRLGLLGANGSGKTTLIRLLTGQLNPDSGEIFRADGLRVVVFDQNRNQLNPTATLRRALSPGGDIVTFRGNSMHVSGWAQQFLFRTDQLDLPITELSGGEQARILIANIMRTPADVLILDEPTNDLDIASLEVLEEGLLGFPGAMVLVTHDRYMLDRVSTEVLGLDGKGAANLYADVSQWQTAQEAVSRAQESTNRAAATKDRAIRSPAVKKLSYMEQRELSEIEGKIADAEAELHEAQKAMDDAAVLTDHKRLSAACQRADQAQQKVAALYDRWESLDARK